MDTLQAEEALARLTGACVMPVSAWRAAHPHSPSREGSGKAYRSLCDACICLESCSGEFTLDTSWGDLSSK